MSVVIIVEVFGDGRDSETSLAFVCELLGPAFTRAALGAPEDNQLMVLS